MGKRAAVELCKALCVPPERHVEETVVPTWSGRVFALGGFFAQDATYQEHPADVH